ncbi:MAG TPA: hypothetical protein VEG39_16740 [Clostridia bacterium]|nr:hypothetical protein [Clostridia bacterium]
MTLLGKRTGTATITAYSLPRINEIILSYTTSMMAESLRSSATAHIIPKPEESPLVRITFQSMLQDTTR